MSEPASKTEQTEQTGGTGALHTRTVRHALFTYSAPDGSQRVALRGQQVEINATDLARGEEHEAFETDDEPLVVHTVVAEPATPDIIAEHPAGVGRPASAVATVSPYSAPVARPARNAPKGEWEAYAVDQGMDEDRARAASKQELVEHRYPVT